MLFCTEGKSEGVTLKGHGQLARISIRHHFIANLHTTDTVFNQYDKNNKQKSTQKQVFQIENQAKHYEN